MINIHFPFNTLCLSPFSLCTDLLFVCARLHHGFKVHWISRRIEIFIYRGGSSRTTIASKIRRAHHVPPSNMVDHAQTRVRNTDKDMHMQPLDIHIYSSIRRLDLHVISKSGNTGHGSDFHGSRVALTRTHSMHGCRTRRIPCLGRLLTRTGPNVEIPSFWALREIEVFARCLEGVGWRRK